MSSSKARIIRKPDPTGERVVTLGLDGFQGKGRKEGEDGQFQPLFAAGGPEKAGFSQTSFEKPSEPAPPVAEPEPEPTVSDNPQPETREPGESPAQIEEELDRKIHEAFTHGLEEGKVQAGEGLAALCRMLSAAADELQMLHERIMRQTEDDLVKLAISVARKVIHQEISHDRRILKNMVTEAIKNIAEKDEIVIRLNPEDYRVVTANTRLYLPELTEKRHLTLRPDDEVTTGGCVVDTAMGSIDARIEAQLEEIYRRLTEERGAGGAPEASEPEERP